MIGKKNLIKFHRDTGDTQRPAGEIESAVQPSEAWRRSRRKKQICRENLVNDAGDDNDNNGKQQGRGGSPNNRGGPGDGRGERRKKTEHCFPFQNQQPQAIRRGSPRWE